MWVRGVPEQGQAGEARGGFPLCCRFIVQVYSAMWAEGVDVQDTGLYIYRCIIEGMRGSHRRVDTTKTMLTMPFCFVCIRTYLYVYLYKLKKGRGGLRENLISLNRIELRVRPITLKKRTYCSLIFHSFSPLSLSLALHSLWILDFCNSFIFHVSDRATTRGLQKLHFHIYTHIVSQRSPRLVVIILRNFVHPHFHLHY